MSFETYATQIPAESRITTQGAGNGTNLAFARLRADAQDDAGAERGEVTAILRIASY
jgi:hypothetical protein